MGASFPPALAANVPPDQVLLGGSVNPAAPAFQAASEWARVTPAAAVTQATPVRLHAPQAARKLSFFNGAAFQPGRAPRLGAGRRG